MSATKLEYQMKCSRCGDPYMLRHLETNQPDPDCILLHALVKQIAKNGLCINCQKTLNYHVKQQIQGNKTDFNARIMTAGLILPGGPDRIICEDCGGGNNPLRNTCRYCKKPLNRRRLFDARGRIYGS